MKEKSRLKFWLLTGFVVLSYLLKVFEFKGYKYMMGSTMLQVYVQFILPGLKDIAWLIFC